MRTNVVFLMIFALGWILLTRCEKEDEIDTTKTQVILDYLKAEIQDTTPGEFDYIRVTFHWHIENTQEGVTYYSAVTYYFPWVGYTTVDVGEETELTVYIPCPQTTQWFRDYAPFEWSVTVKSSDGNVYHNLSAITAYQSLTIVKPRVILDSLKAEIQDTTPGEFDYKRNIRIIFYWHIENPWSEESHYTLSVNPKGFWFWGEEWENYIVGNGTEYTIELSSHWNWNGYIKWAVAGTNNGRLYESDTLIANILPKKSNIKVVLDGPPNDAKLIQGYVTFSCHLENSEPGVTYTYGIFFDKGPNPFDTWFETWADIGENTEYTCYMSASWWGGFGWGIAVEGSDGSVGHSETRSARIIKE